MVDDTTSKETRFPRADSAAISANDQVKRRLHSLSRRPRGPGLAPAGPTLTERLGRGDLCWIIP